MAGNPLVEGKASAGINEAFFEPSIGYGTSPEARDEMNRARHIQMYGIEEEARRRAAMDASRGRQLEGVRLLGDRVNNTTSADLRDLMGREAAMRGVAGAAMGGDPIMGQRAVQGMEAGGNALAASGAEGRIIDRAQAQDVYGGALDSMRGQDTKYGLGRRDLDQGWRQFREKLSGAFYDQGRDEMDNRNNLSLQQAINAHKFNQGMGNIDIQSKEAADKRDLIQTGAKYDAGKEAVSAIAKHWRDE